MSVHTETAPAVTPTATRAESPERSRSGAPEAAPRRARSRELEGYRGIAALAIVAFHVCQYALAGTTNPVFSLLTRFEVVDVLFAMSAFLLTLSYARSAIDGDDPQSAGTFLFRRAVRILPLYWVGVVTVWAVRNPTLHADWLDLFEHLTFTQIFDQQRIFYTLGPTWSMSLEIFFYALLVVLGPAAVRLCRRLPSRRQRVRVLLGGCGALFAIPVIWNAVAFLGFHVSYDHWPVYFGPQSRFGAFAVGMALAVFAASRRSEPLFRGVWPSVLRVAALAIVLGATALNRAGTYGQVAYHDIAALGWLLLLASTVLGERGQTWSRWLSWRPLTLAGLISYSTYMWHEPVMMLLGHVGLTSRSAAALPWSILTVLVVSVLVGAVSYRVIEYPTGKLRALRGRDGRSRNYYPELTSTGNR